MSSATALKKKLDIKISTSVSDPETPKQKPKEVPPPTQQEMNLFYKELFQTNTKPVMLSTIEPYCSAYVPRVVSEEFPKALGNIYNPKLLHSAKDVILEYCASITKSLTVTDKQALNVEVATRQQAKTKLWNRFRAGRVTASKARAAVKTNTASPAQSLVRSICYPDMIQFNSQATRWGSDHEEAAKKEFLEEMKSFHETISVEPCGFFIDPKHVWIGVSPDGIVSCDCCGSSLLEIKCPYNARNVSVYEQKLNYLDRTDEGRYFLNRDNPYYFQIQTQLGVTGKDLCFFVVWTNRDIHVERIMFDSDLYSEISTKTKILFDFVIMPELVAKFFSARHAFQSQSISQIHQPVKGEITNHNLQHPNHYFNLEM